MAPTTLMPDVLTDEEMERLLRGSGASMPDTLTDEEMSALSASASQVQPVDGPHVGEPVAAPQRAPGRRDVVTVTRPRPGVVEEFGAGLEASLRKRGAAAVESANRPGQTFPERALQVAGEGAGVVNDFLGGGFKALGRILGKVPGAAAAGRGVAGGAGQVAGAAARTGAGQAAGRFAQQAVTEYQGFSPRARDNLRALANIGGLAAGAEVAGGGARAAGGVMAAKVVPAVAAPFERAATARAAEAAGVKQIQSLADQAAAAVKAKIDPELAAVTLVTGEKKRVVDVTGDEARALLDAEVKARAPQLSQAEQWAATRQALDQLKGEMVKLRRDVREQPLTVKELKGRQEPATKEELAGVKQYLSKEELREARKGGRFEEPLRSGDTPLATPKKVEPAGAVGWGGMVNERMLRSLSEKKASATPDFDQLVSWAQAYKLDRSLDNPLVIAGESSLGSAFDMFNTQIKKLAAHKEGLLAQSSAKISLKDIKRDWQVSLGKVARSKVVWKDTVDEMGQPVRKRVLANVEGGHKIDPDSDAALLEITNALMDAPDVVDAKFADDLKRFIQHRRYSAVGNLPEIASRLSGDFAERLRGELNEAIGPDYRIVNEHLRDYIGLEEILSRGLGKPIDIEQGIHAKSAAVMKRAGDAITATDLQMLFREVKKLSGGYYDPYQASAYAEAAMRVVGDEPIFRLSEASRVANIANGLGGTTWEIVRKNAPAAVAVAAKKGKSDADWLVDYWRRAQKRYGPPQPPSAAAARFGSPRPGGGPSRGPAAGPGSAPLGGMPTPPAPRPVAPPPVPGGAAAEMRRLGIREEGPRAAAPEGPPDDNPFEGMDVLRKGEMRALREAEQAPTLRPGELEATTAPRLTPEEMDLHRMTEAGPGPAAPQGSAITAQTGYGLRTLFFPRVGKGKDVALELLEPKQQKRLNDFVERINSMHDNDRPEWSKFYGKKGWPDRGDVSADDVVDWINQSPSSLKELFAAAGGRRSPLSALRNERGAVGGEDLTRKARKYDLVNNEGGEGYNPYRAQMRKAADVREKAEPRTGDDVLRDLERYDSSIARESDTYDEAKVTALRAELAALEKKSVEDFATKWPLEVTKQRRAEWNNKVKSGMFGRGAIDYKKLAEEQQNQGWTVDELRRAVTLYKLDSSGSGALPILGAMSVGSLGGLGALAAWERRRKGGRK